MSRPSEQQIEKLIQFLEENPGIAKGHLRSAQARLQTKKHWEEVSLILNAIGGATKDAKSWAKFWADKKYALKKLVSQQRRSASRTGGGVEKLPPLTDLDERLLSLMGGSSFAEGDQELSVPLGVPLEPVEPSPMPIVIQIIEEEPSISQTAPQNPEATPTPRRSPRRRRRPQLSQLDIERDRLLRIEQRRVDAELVNAEGLRGIVEALNNIANAITCSVAKIVDVIQNKD